MGELTIHAVDLVKNEVIKFQNFLANVRTWLADKDEDLEIRWGAYLQIQPFLPTDSSYQDFDELGEVSWYDDFYLERGETMQLDMDFIKMATSEFRLSEQRQNNLKEEILAYAHKEGYGSFRNDW